ncbi:Zn-dependent exopeptidase [Thozetella sp. PMI_491]|nr:Zn-dependent exopeptidase [Thozetella sp. PMI_491]
MLGSVGANALLLLTAQLGLGAAARDSQVVLGPSPSLGKTNGVHTVSDAILAALEAHPDPVDALIALQPDLAAGLAEPRLLHVAGEKEAAWMTEGDKLRLRREKKKFIDITDHRDFYAQQQAQTTSGKAHMPPLSHKSQVKSLFPQVSTDRMRYVLENMTGFRDRYFGGTNGALSAQWLHDHIAKIIETAPFGTHISLEFFTHPFPQSSIIARFEPKVRNFSHPLTILGAHQDFFPLLPAPGADDDCSGTVSILEAFQILAENGFVPLNGPVEFHWYAAEEGGLLGSQAIARYKKESGATIGAMLEFDMTAFIARNATESIGLIKTQADAPLTDWMLNLAKEYSSIASDVFELGPNAGSDYMSYTRLNYPAAFASEGNPLAGGFPGEYDPYVHTVNDRMDVDDETGYFSLDHMARFTELALAFAVEQAGTQPWR